MADIFFSLVHVHTIPTRADVFVVKHESRNIIGMWKIQLLIFKPVLSSLVRQEPKPAGAKNRHFKLLNNPEISDISTLVL